MAGDAAHGLKDSLVPHPAGRDLVVDHGLPEPVEILPGGLPEEPAADGPRQEDCRREEERRRGGEKRSARFHAAAFP